MVEKPDGDGKDVKRLACESPERKVKIKEESFGEAYEKKEERLKISGNVCFENSTFNFN